MLHCAKYTNVKKIHKKKNTPTVGSKFKISIELMRESREKNEDMENQEIAQFAYPMAVKIGPKVTMLLPSVSKPSSGEESLNLIDKEVVKSFFRK